MNRFVIAIALLALACGGRELDPALGKAWVGMTTVIIGGGGQFSYASRMTISVNGDTAIATDICQGGGGNITAKESRDDPRSSYDPDLATWTGSEACSPIPQTGSDCSLVYTFTTASLSLSRYLHTLDADFDGTVADNCGLNTNFGAYFHGS
jgi:hypothetical protein